MKKTILYDMSTMPQAQNGGLFVGQPGWIHPKRSIGSFELILVRSGVVPIEEGGVRYEVGPGHILVLWPDTVHGGTEPSAQAPSFYWLHFTLPGKADRVDSQHALKLNNIGSRQILLPKVLKLPKPEHMEDLFAQFLHTQEVGYYTPFIFDILLSRMLLEITEQMTNAPDMECLSKSDILALQVLAWIESHWRLPVTIEDAAVELGFNHDYIGRCFKAYVGTTFQKHLNELRIQKAKAMLRTSSLRVKEIAYKVGFKDEKHFIKVFKLIEGVSPMQCRRLYHARHENLE